MNLRAGWCRHFNGIQHDACGAGVVYDALLRGGMRLPCFPKIDEQSASEAARCAKRAEPSAKEIEAARRERDRRRRSAA